MLIILGGLPGAGKSTLARFIAQDLKAIHLRIDTIEDALKDASVNMAGPEGYMVAYKLAEDNLTLGLHVIADSVNPLEVTRQAWREVAERARTPFIQVEVTCSDSREHRRRVEARHSASARQHEATWDAVWQREYEPWSGTDLVVNTFGRSVAAGAEEVLVALRASNRYLFA